MNSELLPLLGGLLAAGLTFARMLKTRQESDCPS